MADTTPQTLLAQAKCYQCYAPNLYTLKLIEVALLVQILNASGGGGGAIGQVLQNAASAPPPNPGSPAISYPTGGGGISEWDVASQQWI